MNDLALIILAGLLSLIIIALALSLARVINSTISTTTEQQTASQKTVEKIMTEERAQLVNTAERTLAQLHRIDRQLDDQIAYLEKIGQALGLNRPQHTLPPEIQAMIDYDRQHNTRRPPS